MTENKRFKLGDFDSVCEMLELLNTQRLVVSDMEKENQELKKENEELKEIVKQLQIDNMGIQKRYDTFFKAPIWFTQDIKLTDKQNKKVAEAIEKDLKERGIKYD